MYNPQSVDETVQGILLCEFMMKSTETTTMCTLDERIRSTKKYSFVNKFPSSLDAIEKKKFNGFVKRKTQYKRLRLKTKRPNHKDENCYHKYTNINQQSEKDQSVVNSLGEITKTTMVDEIS